MSSAPALFCPVCSQRENQAVAMLWTMPMTVKEELIGLDGKLIKLTVECPTCKSRISVTQHAVKDEHGGYSVL